MNAKDIERLDLLSPSPSVRAAKVKEIIDLAIEAGEFNHYDVQCYVIEHLGAKSLTELNYLQAEIMRISQLFYLGHYNTVAALANKVSNAGRQVRTELSGISDGIRDVKRSSDNKKND